MIEDVSRHSGGEVSADVCILGSGPAGITIARMLAAQGKSVIMAEGGGMEFEEESQELYSGSTRGGDRPYPIMQSRLRFFGGTSNHWTGMCAPLMPLDMEKREWVPRSGWPFGREVLDPFYVRAHEILDLGEYEYSTEVVRPEGGFVPFREDVIESRIWRRSPPTRFRLKYRDEIEQSELIRCVTHANFLGMESTDDGKRVTALLVGDGASDPVMLRAEVFVMACGGMENSRLLLHAPDAVLRAMGPSAEMIGRCFIDHVWQQGALLIHPTGDWREKYRGLSHNGTRVIAGICLNEDFLRRERMQGISATFGDDVSPEGVREGTDTIGLSVHVEPAPNPDCRIFLDERRDRLGLKRLRFHWRLSESDRETMVKSVTVLAEELGRMQLGRVRLGEGATQEVFPQALTAESHHMGGTRMTEDPAEGVVDADCRLHGVENFYIGGSSVYPTVGYVNPTLTVVAMALRLGDHLNTVV